MPEKISIKKYEHDTSFLLTTKKYKYTMMLENSEQVNGGNVMNGNFGKFIEQKRKALGMTLRGLAAELAIAPAFMSDIEKGHRYPPNKEKLYDMARILRLNEEDTNTMFDLAAGERDNTVSPDLPEYIMGNEKARIALRMARDCHASEATWQKVIEMLEREEKEKHTD
jgi:transcriptional regulator with XRE-family HTH domain